MIWRQVSCERGFRGTVGRVTGVSGRNCSVLQDVVSLHSPLEKAFPEH